MLNTCMVHFAYPSTMFEAKLMLRTIFNLDFMIPLCSFLLFTGLLLLQLTTT
jgi:hypothetical protein